MTDSELDRIIDEKKRKYIPAPSTQLFHGGVIFLVSLVIGLIYFQFEPIPLDVKSDDVGLLRQGFGVWLGAFIAFGGTALYLIWTLWRSVKAKQEARAEIWSAALKRLEKK